MKINLFFVDEHSSSKRNGIGTFRDALLPELAVRSNVCVTLISLNADCDTLTVSKRDFGLEYALPFVAGGKWRDAGELVWPLLKLYIPDRRGNVFLFNHSPAAPFITAMKSLYPRSRTAFVIHDQGWCARLFGDSRLLAGIESGTVPDCVSEGTARYVADYCGKERDIYALVDSVVCLSDSTEAVLRDIYGVAPEKIVKIHNGLPSCRVHSRQYARKRLGLRPDEKLLLFVARPAPHKGIEPILRALDKVRVGNPFVRCALVGSMNGFVSYQHLEKQVAANLIYTGHLTRDEMSLWYSAADVGVMSSYTEQCSFAALEMMGFGLTIVSSDGNGLKDVFIDGKNAFVAPVGRVVDMDPYVDSLARAIDKAINVSDYKRRRMKSCNRLLMSDKYSMSAMADGYYGLLESLVTG